MINSAETAPDRSSSLPRQVEREWARYLDVALRAVLWTFLASLPFNALYLIERNGFVILLALLALWCLYHRRLFYQQTSLELPLLALIGWIAFTIPFSQFPLYSAKEFGKLLQGVIIFYAVLWFLRDEANRKILVYLILGVTALVALHGISQFDPYNQQAMTSFLSSEVWLTTYLVMFIPLCLVSGYGEHEPWKRRAGVAVGFIAIACLVLTRSRAGALALVVELALLAWLFRKWRGVLVGMLAAVVLAGGLWVLSLSKSFAPAGGELIPMNKNVGSIIHRFDIWAFTLAEIAEHPLVGIGYGKDNYLLVYGEEEETVEPGHARVKDAGTHNIVLYFALHVGIPGAVLFMWLMIRIVQTIWNGVKEASDPYAYGILAGSLVGVIGAFIRFQFDHMLIGTLAVLFWTLLALGIMHVPAPRKAGCLSTELQQPRQGRG